MRPAVESAVRDAKRRELARKVAEDFLTRVNEGSSDEQAARALGLSSREFGPFSRVQPPLDSPELVGVAFGLEPGTRSGIIDVEQGLYVIRSIEKIPADSAAFEAEVEEFRATAVREARQARVRNYLAALRTEADVEDNRVRALQRAQEQQALQQPI